MIKLRNEGVYLFGGVPQSGKPGFDAESGRLKTISAGILGGHSIGGYSDSLKLRFDGLISHDITYVGIIQTARASGMEKFPLPYALTNCHNSLCAVGGTINEDDHVFGLSAAKKYGGVYVPANMAVIHQYAREMMAGCGKMILGSDSHTRYGPLGCMGVGEGGPELVKQLLENTYDIRRPEVVLVWVTGKVPHGVGPQDVAIALCGAVYDNGFAKNKILEFVGPGIKDLPMDFRMGIDVMTTETACLSSVWETDSVVEEYLTIHGRQSEYKALSPREGAYYDAMIQLNLSSLEPMAAMPFHPSKAVTIRELKANAGDILRSVEKDSDGKISLSDKLIKGQLVLDQGVIAGCSGGMYDNIAHAAAILEGQSVGSGYFSLSIYPPSIPVNLELIKNGVQQKLMESGALFKPCFCGPCFGAGDVPANNALSIRHTTRNFLNREGSKPSDGQMSAVILMDARSIAATAARGGVLTSAAEIEYKEPPAHRREFDGSVYQKRVYFGVNNPEPEAELRMGPNITNWPEIPPLTENLLLKVATVLNDPVTTTDELIPSGETSSYRSNPLKLASFTLSRRDPGYVDRARAVSRLEGERASGLFAPELELLMNRLELPLDTLKTTQVASVLCANKPGDGSAREQAASCQRVLGGGANICREFATKRYRSNCINWGMLPLIIEEEPDWELGDWIYIPHIREVLQRGQETVRGLLLRDGSGPRELNFSLKGLTNEERQIILDGCLMNYYAAQRKREGK